MKGLLYKELLTSKVYGLNLLLMVGLATVLAIILGGSLAFISMILMMYLMLTSATLAQGDETSNWNRYAISMPLTRRSIVGARYLFLVLMMLFFQVVIFILSSVLYLVGKTETSINEAVIIGGLMCLVFLFFNSVSLPLAYKFGGEKSRYIILAIYLIPYLGVVWLADDIMTILASITPRGMVLFACVAGVLLVALYILSFLLSVKIVKKKDY